MFGGLGIQGLGLTRSQGVGGGSPSPDAMFSDFAVSADGWKLTGTIVGAKDGGTYAGLNDKATPGMVLEVTSKSWTAAGAETTITRNVYATSVLRQPYNNGTLLQETEDGADVDVVWSLSQRVFADDTIVGCTTLMAFFTDNGSGGSSAANPGGVSSVTNNSALTYEPPTAGWLTPPLERVTSASWAPRLIVGHRRAQQGQPVRAVKFTATDQHSHSATSTVSAMTTGQYSASGLYTAWFEPSWSLSGFTDGDTITVDAIIYPWVGDSYTLSVSADAAPSPNICQLLAICDVGGTYGTVYAYVDGVGGGTPAASTNAATAATTPYATIQAAAVAAQTLNNSTYGRNNTSGVTVRIAAATTATGFGTDTMDTTLTVGPLPLLIEGVNQSTSILGTSSTNNDVPAKIKFKNLTFQRASGADAAGIEGRNNGVADQIVFEDVIFDNTGATNPIYTSWVWKVGRMYFVNCPGVYAGQGANGTSSNKHGTALVVGCPWAPNQAYTVCASKALRFIGAPVIATTGAALGTSKSLIWQHNALSSATGSNVVLVGDLEAVPSGFHLIGNTLEFLTGVSGPALSMSADGAVTAVANYMETMNTVVGARTNIGYQDTGTVAVLKDVVSKHSYHLEWNSKSDYFITQNANRTGNWALRHGVDGGYRIVAGNSGDNSPDYDAWIGEGLGDAKNEMPVGDVLAGNAQFVSNLSGGGGGGGDYTPGPTTALPFIPAGETILPIDYKGRAIPTNGTARAGALQMAP